MVKILGFHCCGWAQPLVRELRSCKPHAPAIKRRYLFFHLSPNRQVFYVTYFPIVSSPETFFSFFSILLLASRGTYDPILKASIIFLLRLVPWWESMASSMKEKSLRSTRLFPCSGFDSL